ncbi:MBL fold metallo-hydrolase [Pseudarthrobacter sp. Fe7]|nr:MBL fold metallo-hydrolase [Pseudarthrobacter sp. Fe7]
MAAGRYIPEFSVPLDRWFIAPVLWSLPTRARRRIEAAGDITDVVHGLPRSGEVPGLPGWVAIPTPGHTAGHVAYWRSGDGVLLTGDAVITVNLNSMRGLLPGEPDLSGPPWFTTWNWKLSMDSITRLAEPGPPHPGTRARAAPGAGGGSPAPGRGCEGARATGQASPPLGGAPNPA